MGLVSSYCGDEQELFEELVCEEFGNEDDEDDEDEEG